MTATRARRPFVIGVTGNIACGKSTVLEILSELGAETIDADRLYHSLIEPGQPLATAILNRFGDAVAGPGDSIDRAALARIVFSDPKALSDLDAITHPVVISAARNKIALSRSRVVAIDAIKLVESGMYRECDQVWLVECNPEIELERLIHRNGLSRDQALQRIGAQPPLEQKRRVADLIIDNDGDRAETRRQVESAWSRISILPS